jgi:hypothetical protein
MTTWTIDDIPVEYVARETPPTLTRGAEVTLPLLFRDRGEDAIVEPSDSRYGIQYGFNYEGPRAVLPFRKHYEAILDYLDYSGEATVRYGTGDRGVPWFRERLPDAAPIDSLVVPVDAPSDSIEDRSLWAILVDGVDQSNVLSGGLRRVEVTLFVLAERDAYADRAAVTAAFGDEITVS